MNELLEERRRIYRSFVETGGPPEPSPLWPQLAGERWIVLDENGEMLMAHPFAARPTAFPVRSGEKVWYANCVWDALVIPAVLGVDAEIPAWCAQTRAALPLRVRDQKLEAPECVMHFAVPVRHWWDNIVFT